MINFMLGPAALSIYNLGQKLMEIVEFPLRSFTVTAMPEMSAAFNQNHRAGMMNIMMKYIGILTLLLLPAVLFSFAFADQVIVLIGGKSYAGTEAANVFRIFMTFALLVPIDRFLAVGLDVIHLPQINFYKVLVMLIVNLVADYLGVMAFGNAYGIAAASLFPTLIAVGVGYYYMKKHYMPYEFSKAYKVGWAEIKTIFQRGIAKYSLKMQ
jgi:O-antigen/teichoic acid export membrane protein